MRWLALKFIWCYKYLISPLLPGSCRYLPTCADYAAECYKSHGFLKASWFTFKRLIRCSPFGGDGFDPPPER